MAVPHFFSNCRPHEILLENSSQENAKVFEIAKLLVVRVMNYSRQITVKVTTAIFVVANKNAIRFDYIEFRSIRLYSFFDKNLSLRLEGVVTVCICHFNK